MTTRRLLLSTLFCVLFLATTLAVAKRGGSSDRLVVMIDHDSRGFKYTINSEKVSDLLLALSQRRKGQAEPEVVMLVHHETTIAMVNNVIGILSKAGYEAAPRTFIFDSYKKAMNEVNFTYSPRIAFSAKGDVPAKVM